ncbi:hypothetical protein G7K_6151-t1 [Saitoella complicata NRRL Y-17804]|uniref:Uncharacterized protein n=1 Tax=Saitoella complicata (strain BCRC 22490 / CBS 7301 / JCM 7358 / NBRC 10748 / NRRL Y-17804) TaxID=698492 RepID=A0A0E9NQE1_SAICN|nr:hypothetical protein G7K_6151-t1 [Saitoella complicata NRRL Y-17804]
MSVVAIMPAPPSPDLSEFSGTAATVLTLVVATLEVRACAVPSALARPGLDAARPPLTRVTLLLTELKSVPAPVRSSAAAAPAEEEVNPFVPVVFVVERSNVVEDPTDVAVERSVASKSPPSPSTVDALDPQEVSLAEGTVAAVVAVTVATLDGIVKRPPDVVTDVSDAELEPAASGS